LRAVVFDLDGVITRFNLEREKIKAEFIEYFRERGLVDPSLTPSTPYSLIKDAVAAYFSGIGRGAEVEAMLRDADRIIVEHEIRAASDAPLLPGVKGALTALKAMGLRLAIFTYNNSQAAGMILRRHGLDGIFDVVVSRDMVSRPKPNPIHLEAVLARLGVQKGETLVVGDSEMDIESARKAGVRVAAVATGLRSRKELAAHGPDFLIGDLSELPALVRGLDP